MTVTRIQNKERCVAQYFVDVWHGRQALEAEDLERLTGMLNDSERQKAQAFKLPLMRDRYIAVRVLLRRTLACYLRTDPADLEFEIGEHGKPRLACGSLHFNLSHSGDSLIIAVADFPNIGVDIETIKPRTSLESIASRCFSDREFERWQPLPAAEQTETFYRLWTKKEPFVKAVGRGIALGLEQCEVEPEQGGNLLAVPAEFGPATAWKTTELAVDAKTCAALVTANCEFTLRRLELMATTG
jgi:4'-phosphopantetheinyl transferase